MRRVLIATSLVCLALAFMVSSRSAAQGQKSAEPAVLTGTWQCMSHGGQNGDLPFTLTLQQDGENVSGHVSSSIGDADLSSSTFKDDHLHIVIAGENTSYVLEASYQAGKLSGTWASSGTKEKGRWEGKKAAQ